MNHKVLLADDSLTIQKVIKITLANQPYDITECFNEDELFKKLPQVQPKIVFLDFNLSEKFTGYELTSKIKAICPQTKVLLLLGTFDTVDDAALEKCGASDKIVKPFDSNKFISICKTLSKSSGEPVVEESALPSDEDLEMPGDDEDTDQPEAEQEISFESNEPEDQWQMSNTAAVKLEETKPEPEVQETVNKPDALALEISDWGMSVPNIINSEKAHEKRFDLPPVITEAPAPLAAAPEPAPKPEPAPVAEPAAKVEKQDYKPFEIKFPDNNDLDYPTIEELQNKEASEPAKEAPKPEAKPRPQLISIEPEVSNDFEFELQGSYVEETTDVKSIEAQIRDEVEEDLWHADEFEELKQEVASKIDQLKNDYEPKGDTFDESMFGRLDANDIQVQYESPKEAESVAPAPAAVAAAPQVDMDKLRSEMEALVKKHVQEYMDQMFKTNVEKVTWEVIPDLAENLIRQELSKIANKIINDQN